MSAQLMLSIPKPKTGWGGARKGAGRPKTRSGVAHDRRPFHDAKKPVHVTVRVVKRVGSLRRWRVAKVIGDRMREVANAERFAQRRRTFRVVEFSILGDHLHLIVEATAARAMSRGVQGLLLMIARLVNRRLQRRGKLFADRYHARELGPPREVRNAVGYALANQAHHDHALPEPGTEVVNGIDPLSSARWFNGWKESPPPAAGRGAAE